MGINEEIPNMGINVMAVEWESQRIFSESTKIGMNQRSNDNKDAHTVVRTAKGNVEECMGGIRNLAMDSNYEGVLNLSANAAKSKDATWTAKTANNIVEGSAYAMGQGDFGSSGPSGAKLGGNVRKWKKQARLGAGNYSPVSRLKLLVREEVIAETTRWRALQ
jgi:hypothetical protein